MNKRMMLYICGVMLALEAGFMLLPVVTALIYGESAGWVFAAVALAAGLAGLAAIRFSRPKTKTIYAKEGLLTVALCWVLISLVGALPFTLCGEIPSYIDAVFEMVSGFTTTGASILTNVEALSRCTLFWRSFSHWLGGMGVLVFMMAILRMEGGQTIHLLRAESPGPTVAKMVPRMADSSKILYGIYLLLTATEVLFYLAGGMPLFDSLCHAFGTAGTGGFGVKADSFTSYSPYLQWVTTIFMLLFGVNFSVYFFLLRKKFDLAWKNTELRWYAAIVAGAVLLITLNTAGLDMYSGVSEAFRHAAFSVSSIITTTGYGTADFNLWPEFSRMILVLLMCIGACAGSTGGGFKVSRLIILAKSARAELRRLMHPHTVKVLTMDGKRIGQDTVQATANYLIVYVMVTVISILLISLDNFDTTTTITSVVATFNNIGPGLGLVGPTGNYAAFSPMSKIVFCFTMLLGRLELYPMLALMLPSAWKKD